MKYELVIERPESESLEPELQIDYSPKATQTESAELVRELFPMDDPSRGIHRVPQEVEGILRRERMNLSLRAGEKLLSEFFDTDSERSILFLTDSRVIVMASAEPGVSSESSMEYTEMIAVGRSMEAVYFTGRYGEQLGVHGLNVYQAAVLKKGLEAMIAQINAE